MEWPTGKPPAIVLGGNHNALSIARSLGGAGVETYAINQPQAQVRYSRFCKWIDVPAAGATTQESWAAYLLGRQSDYLRGAVLLAASDEAIEVITVHRRALSEKFRLDISNPSAQLCMLNKLSTYRAAQEAGVPTPKFWVADTRQELEQLEDELVFPLILKPLHSHEFTQQFESKFVLVRGFQELLAASEAINSRGIRTFLVEMIPGPDDKLCSYYTYLDENGHNLFDFTKRIIRRYPVNMGLGSYHITDDVPGVKELALKLLQHAGLCGLANVEFKLDERDGQLKLMECNARFTAVDCLLAASGINLPLFVYNRVTGHPQPAPHSYRIGLRLWHPVHDFLAFRQLNKMGMLDLRGWVRSVLHRQNFPVFRWNDPLPALVGSLRLVIRGVSRFVRKRRTQSTQSMDTPPPPLIQLPMSSTATSGIYPPVPSAFAANPKRQDLSVQ